MNRILVKPLFSRMLATLVAVICCLGVILPVQAKPAPADASASLAGNDSWVARITQVDTSQFPQVTVYVSVTDMNGEPVEVSPNALKLTEDGTEIAPQKISGVGELDEPLITLLVMDVSGSMNSAGKLEAAKEAAIAYVKQTRPGDRVGLLVFNTKIRYAQPITSNREKVIKTIRSVKAADDTAMYDALLETSEILADLDGRKAIIALTDGMDNRSRHSPLEIIQAIGPAGLSISTIGLGDANHSQGVLSGLDEKALIALAEQAGGVYGYANDSNSLRQLYERYGRALQHEYAITYLSPSLLRDGINRSLEVSLKGNLATAGQAQSITYNPGGLVPEVDQPASWQVFTGLMVVLLLLLLLPAGIRWLQPRLSQAKSDNIKLSKPTARVKLKD